MSTVEFNTKVVGTAEEGKQFDVVISALKPNSIVYWQHFGTGSTPEDFVTPLYGYGNVDESGTLKIPVEYRADKKTEYGENLALWLFSDPDYKNSIGDTGYLTISDSSTGELGVHVAIGTWKKRIDLYNRGANRPVQDQNVFIDSAYELVNLQGSRYFLILFQEDGSIGNNGWDDYAAELPVNSLGINIKKNFWSIILDDNSNSLLDPGDKLLGEFDAGKDGFARWWSCWGLIYFRLKKQPDISG